MDNTGAGRLCKPRLSLTKALFELPIYLRQFFILKGVFYMQRKRNAKLRALSESALMIALATALGFIKIIDMPYGGAVTIASMLPLALISYRHGLKTGLFAAAVYGGIQQILGLAMLSWATSWQSVVAIVLLDYIVAFTVIGLAGIFRKGVKNQTAAITLGCFTVSLLRYFCHVISGATVWAGLSIPTQAALAFSFAYNATYMLPETIILPVCAVYVASNIDFRFEQPSRMRAQTVGGTAWISPTAGLVGLIAVITDTVLVFNHIQDENGNFVIESLKNVNWTLVIAITAVAAIVIAALLSIRSVAEKNTKQ
jgi:thiamine transporter